MPSVNNQPGRRGERGQAIILFVGIFSVILVMAAIVVDFGLWFAERRSAQRGADLAAAAGALDLPAENGIAAFVSACNWAEANGYPNADVDVEVFERGGSGSEDNCGVLPGDPPTPACGSDCDTVRVTVGGVAPRLFTGALGIGDFEIGAVAAAGLTSGGTGGVGGVGADQTVLLIDSPRRLDLRPNCSGSICALEVIKQEAARLVASLVGAAEAEFGYAPFTYCYQPDPAFPALDGRRTCVPMTWVVSPTIDEVELNLAIDATARLPLGATANLCVGFLQAQQMLELPSSGRRQSIIVVSLGDNNFQFTSYFLGIQYPPAPCRPTLAVSGHNLPGLCSATTVQEREMDKGTAIVAQQLKDEGVEIYVVALNVCSPNAVEQSPTYCDAIWNTEQESGDNVANQRLLKCIASTPDHYQSVSVDELPDAIEQVASEIVSRSLLQ